MLQSPCRPRIGACCSIPPKVIHSRDIPSCSSRILAFGMLGDCSRRVHQGLNNHMSLLRLFAIVWTVMFSKSRVVNGFHHGWSALSGLPEKQLTLSCTSLFLLGFSLILWFFLASFLLFLHLLHGLRWGARSTKQTCHQLEWDKGEGPAILWEICLEHKHLIALPTSLSWGRSRYMIISPWGLS